MPSLLASGSRWTLPPHELRRVLAETRAVYRKADAAFAPFSCPASGECCQLGRTGRPPWLWPSEWLVLKARLGDAPLPPTRADGSCPFLVDARCSVYADRPLGCRTYFCERVRGPARQPAEVLDALLRRLEALHQDHFPDGASPRPLLEGWHPDEADRLR